MPADTYGAIFAYNHADWYVAEVLANAACYAPAVGGGGAGAFALTPQLQVLSCQPGPGLAQREVPAEYLDAFESAAARYDLGQRGVWALAAVARLESNFGRGMSKARTAPSRPARPRPERVEDATRSTATKTAASATPTRPTRPRPWRG